MANWATFLVYLSKEFQGDTSIIVRSISLKAAIDDANKHLSEQGRFDVRAVDAKVLRGVNYY
jgi:hypothetical protein